jgi:allophanate hydrolase
VVDEQDAVYRVTAAFDAVDALDDPAVFIHVCDREAAMAAANPEGPLAGLSFVAKNNIDVAGITTTAGHPRFARTPETSAPAVQRLVDAGATCLGGTNLDQFATGLVGTRSPYGVPVNAVDPRLVPGGSSSGSAVAVARGVADFGLGTDTAGSGRVPAAHNRIIGIKPTVGRVPTRGVVPAVLSLDCVSIFSRTFDVARQALAAVSGIDPDDPFSRHPGPGPVVGATVVVGVPRSVSLSGQLDDAAWEAAVAQLRSTPGVEIVAIDLDPFVEVGEMLYGGPWVAERHVAVGDFLAANPDGADPTVAAIIGAAADIPATEAYRASYELARLRHATLDTWNRVDVLFVPTCPGVATLDEVAAEPVARNSELGRYTNFVNLLDLAALAMPGPDRTDGLPFGVTFVGPAWSDELLLEIGERYGSPTDGPEEPFAPNGAVDVVVVGAHLEGQPLNWQLTDLGGRFVRATTTTPDYRLYRLAGDGVAKPALVRVGDGDAGGAAIEVEVWRLPSSAIGAFSQFIPAPLGLGRVRLADGSDVTGFIGEPLATDAATDITEFGAWRAYLASL